MGAGERAEGLGVSYFSEVMEREQRWRKRTEAGEIEIGMPKRIWAASFSEARAPKRMTEGTAGERRLRWRTGGGERGQVRSKKRGGMLREKEGAGVRGGACVSRVKEEKMAEKRKVSGGDEAWPDGGGRMRRAGGGGTASAYE